MLDRYWFGDSTRLSPEAPVPIVRIMRTENRLGGAANVASNLASLGVKTGLLSVVGEDEAGEMVENILREKGIEPHLHHDSQLKTTVKLRIISRQQQVLRTDFEDHPNRAVLTEHLDDFTHLLDSYEAVVLSDYAKGGLDHITQMINLAKKRSIPVLIDPKGTDFDRYKGATVITPNRNELAAVVGEWRSEEELFSKASALREHLDLQALLLTRSEEGMTLFTAQGAQSVPAQTLEVFDVSGAGDTVIAVFAAMIASGKSFEEAMKIANRAGGIVVAKLGTATLTFNELFGR
ncbi:MAG TPA: D-glycero-beta-D-manno-heptose-7-phosphate kinase [Sutterella sp.]|nr:D-glycero-beta-D-manno-heptose-7-phosphate kinase [Sutterella sp.]